MARKRKRDFDLEAVWAELVRENGMPPLDLAKRFNTGTKHLMLDLENNGYLLSEDEYGWIYPFRKVEVEEHDGKTAAG